MLDVLTITLNPAIDQTVNIDNFEVNKVNRITNIQNDPGGKGINVAAYIAATKLKVGATGFLGNKNASLFKNLFDDLNIEDKFIYLEEETRTNVKVVDKSKNTVTDLNQAGFNITIENKNDLEKLLFTKKLATWYVFSGSLPLGLSNDIYKQWIEKAHDIGVKVALDASGEALKVALDANPDLIKPNINELSYLYDRKLIQLEDILKETDKLIKNGIKKICISMGEKGAILTDDKESYHAVARNVNVITTVGAGDAMLSGLIVADIKNLNLKKSLELSTAYSMSAVETIGPYLPSEEKLIEYSKNIEFGNYYS